MASIFYDPRVHDFGTPAAQGMQSGLAMMANAQQMEANQMKMDQQKKVQAALDEIKEAHKEYEGAIKPTAESSAGFEPTQAGRELAAETGGFVGAAEKSDDGSKPLVAKAQFMTKARDIFTKHGLVDQAMAIENNYMKHVGTIATTIGKKAALKELKQGMFKDSFEGVTEKDIEVKDGAWKIEKMGPNNDGIVTMSPDGKVTVVQKPTEKEEKEKDERTEEFGHGQRRFVSGPRKGEVVKVPTAPREGRGASGKDEEWTIPKTRMEWDKIESYTQKRSKEITDELNRIEDPDERAASHLNTELDSLRKVQKNIPLYRKNDADAVKQGHEPVNIGKVASYLSAPGESKGGTSGKVGDEAKGLIKGKFTKVVEDPKTKKRYGVKPDGTKELIQ